MQNETEMQAKIDRLLRCVNMAMGCIDPLSSNPDERLAWYRLLDAIDGQEPREKLESELRPRLTHPRHRRGV